VADGRAGAVRERRGRVATVEVRARLQQELQRLEDRLDGLRSTSEETTDGKVLSAAEPAEAAQAVELQELISLSTARLVERGRRLRRALTRIASGGYGICEECGGRIALPRLCALPDAVTCVRCQELLERRRPTPPRGIRVLPGAE
jgi:DnaK suppressor protein